MFKILLTITFLYLIIAILYPWEKKRDQLPIHKNELYYNNLFCESVGGNTEVKHSYQYGSKRSYIKVDCETKNFVYEGGIDKRSSLDSIQQAIFFSTLTKKKPAIVIFDTNGKYGKYERRIKASADKIGIKFIRVKYESMGKN